MNKPTGIPIAHAESMLARLLGYLQHDPFNDRLRGDIFDEALRVGSLEIAQQQLDGIDQLDDVTWQYRRVLLLLRCGHYKPARYLCLDLVSSGFDHPSIRYNAAYAALRLGEYDLAQREATELLALTAPPPDSLELLLRSMHYKYLISEGIALFRAYEGRILPTAGALGVASLMAIDAVLFSDAEKWALQALSIDASQIEAQVALGSVMLGKHEPERARVHLEAALGCAEGDGRVLSALAMCDLVQMRLDFAKDHFNKALHAMPEHIGTWHGLAWCCIAQHDLIGAEEAFEVALKLDRNFAESHGGLAVVLALQARKDEAIRAAKLALRLDQKSLSGRYAFALANGEIDGAKSFDRVAADILQGHSDVSGQKSLFDIVFRGRGGTQGQG